MINAIKYFFAKKKRRLTNLTKATIDKLNEVINQYDINVEGELEELKVIAEQDRIKYEKEKEERRIRDEAYEKERKLKEEKEERTITANTKTWSKYLPYVYELVEIQNNIDKQKEMDKFEISLIGFKYERKEDHFVVNGIETYIGSSNNHYYNWLLKPKFKIVDNKFVPVL